MEQEEQAREAEMEEFLNKELAVWCLSHAQGVSVKQETVISHVKFPS